MSAIRIKYRFFFFLFFFLVISRPALAEEPSNYLTITGPCNLEFSKDHGAHPGYRTECWYYTGNLRSQSGGLYGFQLRTDDGGISSVSSGTLVDPEGKTRAIKKDEFAVTILDTWKSPHSKTVYPSRWRLQVFPYSLDLTISPNLADQEMQTSGSTGVTYWEGGVSIRGTRDANQINGQGYVELTGYAERFGRPM